MKDAKYRQRVAERALGIGIGMIIGVTFLAGFNDSHTARVTISAVAAVLVIGSVLIDLPRFGKANQPGKGKRTHE